MVLGSGQNSPLILHYSAIQHQTAGAGRVLERDDAGCMVVIAMWPGGGVHQLWPATMVPAQNANVAASSLVLVAAKRGIDDMKTDDGYMRQKSPNGYIGPKPHTPNHGRNVLHV